jgi:hypothetical protein
MSIDLNNIFYTKHFSGDQQVLVGIVATIFLDWAILDSNHGEENDFSIFQIVHTALEAHPASYSMGTKVLSRSKSGRNVKLTTHPHLVPRLKINGAIPLLPLCPVA